MKFSDFDTVKPPPCVEETYGFIDPDGIVYLPGDLGMASVAIMEHDYPNIQKAKKVLAFCQTLDAMSSEDKAKAADILSRYDRGGWKILTEMSLFIHTHMSVICGPSMPQVDPIDSIMCNTTGEF